MTDFDRDIARLITAYPKIFSACRTRQVTDQHTGIKLTANQLSLIDHLDRNRPMGVQALAVHLGVTPSTVSLAVDRLVENGYICREKNTADGRKTNLYLTKEGEQIKRSRTILDPELVQQLLGWMPDDQRRKALDGLEILADAAEGMVRGRAIYKAWNRDL